MSAPDWRRARSAPGLRPLGRVGLLWAVLCTLLSLVACQPAPVETWRLAVSPWLGCEPLVLAQETGALPPAMRVVELASTTEAARAFRNGLVDVAVLPLDEALRLAGEGVDLGIVAVLSDSVGADAVLARADVAAALVPARPRLPTASGQTPVWRVGLEHTTLAELMLAHWLLQQGLTQADVQRIHLEPADHENALALRQVDLLVSFEPLKSRLEQRGAVPVFDTRDLPGAVMTVLVARPGLNTDRLATLLLAWDRARERLHTAPAPAWLVAGADLSAPQYPHALQGLRFLTLPQMQQRLPTADTAGAWAAFGAHTNPVNALLPAWTQARQPPVQLAQRIDPAPLARAVQLAPTTAPPQGDRP